MKLFGVLLTVLILLGAAVGGVVGVLLPKISSGLALGFLSSLFLAVVSDAALEIVIMEDVFFVFVLIDMTSLLSSLSRY